MNPIETTLDNLVREIVKLRDFECISCGKQVTLQVGHYMSRRNRATRWDLINCNAQCTECNVTKNGNIEVYRERLIEKHGLEVVEHIEFISRTSVKLGNSDLQDLKNELRNELKLLRNE